MDKSTIKTTDNFRTKSDYASLEESALNLWKEKNIFKKSLEKWAQKIKQEQEKHFLV